MKTYHKLLSCCVIIALCATGMLLGGCKRTKTYRTEVATGAAINAMMMTNPMGSLYGKSTPDGDNPQGMDKAVADALGVGCPAIDIGLNITFNPLPNLEGYINLAYNNDCIVHGVTMSGAVSSDWKVIADMTGVMLDSTVAFDNLTMEGRSTDGTIHQVLYTENFIPYAQIDGTLTTTHADGRTRTVVYDTLTGTVDLGNYTEFKTIFPGITITDNNTAALVINGHAQYTNEDQFTTAMTFVDVMQPFGCFMPASGTLHLVNEAKNFDAVIDYGDGTCDSLITLTLKGQEPEEIDVIEWMKTH